MPDLSLDLRHLRCALTVADLGSFRRAAVALDLPQSTVSRRVAHLEHRLGFELFIRDPRGVTLTVAGASFLGEAVSSSRRLDQAAKLARATSRGEVGELRIGFLSSLNTGFLRNLLQRFRIAQTGIHVRLEEVNVRDALHRLGDGEVDVAFIAGAPNMPDHLVRCLWDEAIYVVLPRSHELASRDDLWWRDLRSETFIVSQGGPGSDIEDHLIRTLGAPGFHPRIDVHSVGRESLLNLVGIGYGVTLTTTSSLRTDGDVVFRAVTDEATQISSSAVWSTRNPNPALKHLLALAEIIAKEYALTYCCAAF